MSDSVTKWYEMNEDTTRPFTYSPPKEVSEEDKKDAYKILSYYEKNAILYAAKILKDGSTS